MATLTPREHQVLQHVVAGWLNKQIAADLGIAEKTIKVHRARAMDKMGVASLAELVLITVEADVGAVAEGALHDKTEHCEKSYSRITAPTVAAGSIEECMGGSKKLSADLHKYAA